jgi:hypothetical protein
MRPFACVLAMLLCAGPLPGQQPQYDWRSPAALRALTPAQRRAAREQAVARAGESSRDFVEAYGEDAVAALLLCSKDVSARLVRFHSEGEFGKLPRRAELLRAIAVAGIADDMAVWVMRHSEELKEAETCGIFLRDPVSYGLSLRKLSDGVQQERKAQKAWMQKVNMPPKAGQDAALQEADTPEGLNGQLKQIGMVAGALAIAMLVMRRLRRPSNW